MDVAAFKQKDGTLLYRVVVMNSDGKQYVSDQSWTDRTEAFKALQAHLRALGVPDDQVKISQVH